MVGKKTDTAPLVYTTKKRWGGGEREEKTHQMTFGERASDKDSPREADEETYVIKKRSQCPNMG
jgi:hypothetical protein